MKKSSYAIIAGGIAVAAIGITAATGKLPFPSAPATPALPVAQAEKARLWDFRMTKIDGEPLPLTQFKGQVVLLVNTASMCGFTPQYEGLQKIYSDYKPKGFTVIGVPSGNFKEQEYGSGKKIAEFCETTFGIRFPLTEKSEVVGPKAVPVYRWAATVLGPDQRPRWNFHKYLIGRDGKLITAFGTQTAPTDASVRTAIEKALATKAAA